MTAATLTLTRTANAAEPAGSPPAAEHRTARPVVAARAATATGRRAGPGVLSTGGATVELLLRQRGELPAGHPNRAVLRDRAIEAGLPLSRYLAARYHGRGEPLDDLDQVAALGLIKAVDGYDPTRPVPFASYAVPTIVGALKRHFRDTTWRVRVPRSVQELALSIAPTSEGLAQRWGRSPTRTELATHLGSTEHDVAIATNAWGAYIPASLDAVAANGQVALLDTLGVVDARFDVVNDQQGLQRLLDGLPLRERRILVLRFSGELTQSEIAAQIGVSQMHVSRLLLRTLAALRISLRPEQHSAATP
jgi:RNA polymerase sigma-B factor